ncbi:MAG: hypothetical protein ABUL44_03620, partial [Flavobacterium sp.]
LINQAEKFESTLKENLSSLSDIDEIIYQGSFPWTEKLYTIYFKQDIDFTIDLCLINFESAETFFWEPDGYILFDKLQEIDKCRVKQMSNLNFTRHPFLKSNPFSLSVVTVKKIEKNLYRNHLWNSLELLNILRRYVIQIIRLSVIANNNFLGRVDRDIEDIIPKDINLELIRTAALYDKQDIAEKAIRLIEMLLQLKNRIENDNEKVVQQWILKQLLHEKSKLSNYLNNA